MLVIIHYCNAENILRNLSRRLYAGVQQFMKRSIGHDLKTTELLGAISLKKLQPIGKTADLKSDNSFAKSFCNGFGLIDYIKFFINITDMVTHGADADE